jgi:hypothetical protein
MPRPLQLVTTRIRAFMAVALTGWMLFGLALRSQVRSGPPQRWLFSGLLPSWEVVAINIAFRSVVLWMEISLALGPLRRDEKALLVAFVGRAIVAPIRHLFPGIASAARVVQTLLSLCAFLAALAILLSFWNDRVSASTDEHIEP